MKKMIIYSLCIGAVFGALFIFDKIFGSDKTIFLIVSIIIVELMLIADLSPFMKRND